MGALCARDQGRPAIEMDEGDEMLDAISRGWNALASALRRGAPLAPPLEPVPYVDLARYSGHWKEVARLDAWFQSPNDMDSTATYQWHPERQEMTVHNETVREGCPVYVDGTAIHDPDGRSGADHDGRLLVSFRPNETEPIVSPVPAPYWIISLGDGADYDYAVVSEPNRRYMWILARRWPLDVFKLMRVLTELSTRHGFTADQMRSLRFTRHPSLQAPMPALQPAKFVPMITAGP